MKIHTTITALACLALGLGVLSGCSGADDETAGTTKKKSSVVKVSEKEPNGNPDGSGAQDIGTFSKTKTVVIHGELSSGGNDGKTYTGDYDLYAFDVTAPGSLDASIAWSNGADVDAALYDANLHLVASDGSAANPAHIQVGSASGKYILALFAKDQAAPYEATLAFVASSGSTTGPDCPTEPVQPATPVGGCTLSLTTPACSLADLTSGKSFELDWTTHMTFCEGPHHVVIGGDPPSSWQSGNYVVFSLSSQDAGGHVPDERYGMTRNIGGYFNMNAQDLAGLTSANGLYYAMVTDFYDSRSEAVALRVKK